VAEVVIRFVKPQKTAATNQMRNVCSLSSTKDKRLQNVQLTTGIQKLGALQKLMPMEILSMENGESVILTNAMRTQAALIPMVAALACDLTIGLAK